MFYFHTSKGPRVLLLFHFDLD